MRKITLGRSGIEVTELCFGTLPIGPLQKNANVEDAADIIAHGLSSGITFVDTAQVYKTYPQIRLAMAKSQIIPIISSKSSAKTYEEMQEAVEQALAGLDVRKIDIFLLHAARVKKSILEERESPLRCLLDYREKGIIRAVGISTHVVDVVRAAAIHPEIDIVFPLLNRLGMGIIDGTREEMEAAINECHQESKGVYIMKALAGGNFVSAYKESMDYISDFSAGRFARAIGMLSKGEVDMNIHYMNGEDISSELAHTSIHNKHFVIMKQCTKCKTCVEACHSGAIIVGDGDRAKIDESKCIKCGYCVAACPQFCIRMN